MTKLNFFLLVPVRLPGSLVFDVCSASLCSVLISGSNLFQRDVSAAAAAAAAASPSSSLVMCSVACIIASNPRVSARGSNSLSLASALMRGRLATRTRFPYSSRSSSASSPFPRFFARARIARHLRCPRRVRILSFSGLLLLLCCNQVSHPQKCAFALCEWH